MGFFQPTGGGAKVPRTLQRISMGAAEFRTEEIRTSLDEVITIAAVNVASGTMLGVLGKRAGSGSFELWRQASCGDIENLGSAPIDFDYRTVPAPAFGENKTVAKTNGVKLVAKEVVGDLEFVHYDGFDVRLIRARPDADRFVISKETYSVHKERHDFSFVISP